MTEHDPAFSIELQYDASLLHRHELHDYAADPIQLCQIELQRSPRKRKENDSPRKHKARHKVQVGGTDSGKSQFLEAKPEGTSAAVRHFSSTSCRKDDLVATETSTRRKIFLFR